MEESKETDDLLGNVVRKSGLHSGRNLKGTSAEKTQSPRGSPTLRRVRTPRKTFSDDRWWSLWCFPWNRLVLMVILSIIWMYLGFCMQSKWSGLDGNKPELIGYVSAEKVGNAQNLIGVSRTIDALIDDTIDSTILDSIILKQDQLEVASLKKGRRSANRRLNNNNNRLPKNVPPANDDGQIVRTNTSYGWVIGPFGKTEDKILGWNGRARNGNCDRKSEFGRLVRSKKFVLIFHELSMTGAPLSMLELATEISNCGGSVSVVVLCWKGGLMKELNRRRIRVLKDKKETSYKIARRSDLIIAGSAVCSSWIEQYLARYGSKSTQILWWIMENRREYFDRSKHLLNRVKMLIFLAESQSEQWMKWCKEEKVRLKIEPKTVPLSVNDELAFVAGIPCYLNKPSFKVEDMHAKRKRLRVAVRQELGLSDNDMLVITLSSINPGKGQKLFLESVVLRDADEQIKKQHDSSSTKENNIKVLIGSVGSKSNKIPYVRKMLRYISRNSSLHGSLLWTPATKHVSSIYAAADVYVINAQGIGETFGRVTIEAMAFGLPVLGTDAGGTREIVEDGVTGLLHPIGREGIEPLARNLELLLGDPSTRERLGENIMLLYKKISEADFVFPSWFSFGEKSLITRILDPNPMTRISIPEILTDAWFKKNYKAPVFYEDFEITLDDVDAVFDSEEHHVKEKKEQKPVTMNAFELISLSKGLNLGNLFVPELEIKRETRFSSKCSANEIVSKIEEAAKPLGFDIQKNNYKMKLENLKAGRKGNLNIATEIFQVAPSLHMVELRKARGDTLEFHKFYKNLSTGLKDVVWKSEDDMHDNLKE